MTRYDCELFSLGYASDHEMVERPDGEWVRYAEVEAHIAELERQNADLARSAQALDTRRHAAPVDARAQVPGAYGPLPRGTWEVGDA